MAVLLLRQAPPLDCTALAAADVALDAQESATSVYEAVVDLCDDYCLNNGQCVQVRRPTIRSCSRFSSSLAIAASGICLSLVSPLNLSVSFRALFVLPVPFSPLRFPHTIAVL